MGGWEVFIIPIIGVAVWIISTLIRGAEEAKGPQQPGQRKPDKVTDLDRFLREVHRRRQAAEREEEQPRQAEREEEPPAQAERPRRRRAEGRTAPEAVPVALPVEVVAVPEAAQGPPVMSVLAAAPLPYMPTEIQATPLVRRPESLTLVGLRELFRSRAGLRTAMILQEVFGPPLARRGRVR